MEKCAMQVIKSNKRHLTDGMELPNQDKIRTLVEKETYKYLGILEADTIKQMEMKEKIKKKYLRTRNLLETKLYPKPYQRNKYPGFNSSLDIPDHFWSEPGKNLTKWTKEQEN